MAIILSHGIHKGWLTSIFKISKSKLPLKIETPGVQLTSLSSNSKGVLSAASYKFEFDVR